MNRFRIFSIVSIIAVILFACDNSDEWYNDQYIFLTRSGNTDWNNLKGDECPPVPVYCYAQGCYTFEPILGEIRNNCDDLSLNKSVQLVYGNLYPYAYTGGDLLALNEFPYTQGQISIESINEEGTVYLNYKDSLVVIPINEEIVFRTSTINEDIAENGDTLCIQETVRIQRFVNWGFFDKDNYIGKSKLRWYD